MQSDLERFRRSTSVRAVAAVFLALLAVLPVAAQRAPITAPIDPALEAECLHHLDVGRQYFKKKAWDGAAGRLEEIAATYPEFSRIDEVYYLLGVCYARKQETRLAREMLGKVVDGFPDSEFAKRARAELEKLPKPATPAVDSGGASNTPPGR